MAVARRARPPYGFVMMRVGVTLVLGLGIVACGSRSRLLEPGVSIAGAAGAGGGGVAGFGGGAGSGGSGGNPSGGGPSGGAGGSSGASACNYDEVVAGGNHTCALQGGAVHCFGANQFGQLGAGNATTGVPIPTPLAGPTDFVALSGGEFHSSGVRANGTAMSWGHNALGALGDGTTQDSAVPIPIQGLSQVVRTARGIVTTHACALEQTGRVRCWGENGHGELGDGSLAKSYTPTKVVGITDAVSIAVGYIFSCAALASGGVKCWGWNASGSLGLGNTNAGSYTSPVTVLGLSDAVQVVAGNHHACARRAGGSVSCWGYNGSGQLGIGSNVENAPTPTPVVGLDDAVWLDSGDSHACAVRANGSVSCWGRNYSGQLGDGTTIDHNTPVTVVGLANAWRVATGSEHSCALDQSQGLVCWGGNGVGQLGNGTSQGASFPKPVSCPAATCAGAYTDFIKSHFVPCADGQHVGQVASAPGVTCEQVCCVFGHPSCSHRSAQASFDACSPDNPTKTGGCADVFQEQWSSQCACTP